MDAQKVEMRALSDDRLDAVYGGSLPLLYAPVNKGTAPSGGGQGSEGSRDGNDPVSMFQQILAPLTQGQG
jgi:hypothetical protein